MNPDNTKPLVFLVEDDEFFARMVTLGLENKGYETEWISHGEYLPSRLRLRQPDVIVLDYHLTHAVADGINGGHLLDMVHAKYPATPVIMLTSLSDTREAVKLLKTGAVDFISKNEYFFENLLKSLSNLLLARELSGELRSARRQLIRLQRRLAMVLTGIVLALVLLIAFY